MMILLLQLYQFISNTEKINLSNEQHILGDYVDRYFNIFIYFLIYKTYQKQTQVICTC